MGLSVAWARRFLVGGGLLLLALWWTYSKKPELAPSLHVVDNPTQADVTQPAEPVDDGKSDVERFVDKTIKDHRVVIFSKSYCGFSRKAKRAIGNHLPADKYIVVELDQRDDGWEIQQYMRTLTVRGRITELSKGAVQYWGVASCRQGAAPAGRLCFSTEPGGGTLHHTCTNAFDCLVRSWLGARAGQTRQGWQLL